MRLLRRYPPEVHADPLPREEAPRGEVGDSAVQVEEVREGEREAAGGGGPARRLALCGSHVGVGDVGALRLPQCALYSPTLKESHALTSSSSTRRGAEDPKRERRRGERASASVSRGDLRVSERASETPGPHESAGPFWRDETDPWISAGLPIARRLLPRKRRP